MDKTSRIFGLIIAILAQLCAGCNLWGGAVFFGLVAICFFLAGVGEYIVEHLKVREK